nr:hypothetical protein [Tanacetum cinerariifolium]
MAKLDSFTSMEFESFIFLSFFKPHGATKTLVLAGAGISTFTCETCKSTRKYHAAVSFVYLEEKDIESLIMKWKGKTDVELLDSHEFFNEIYNDGIIPEAPLTVLENTKMGSTLIKAMLRKNEGSVPEARQSVASRL